MEKYLYKVSPPRDNLMFYPSTFWHTQDWESSTTRYRDGYIEDKVLYVGDFNEVNIHLFPRVRTVRVRAIDVDISFLQGCGVNCSPGKTSYILCPSLRREEVESFRPTVFKFNPDGFRNVRNGEYVSWTPQQAIDSETFSMADAVKKWNVEACYVSDLDALIAIIARHCIYFEEQT